MVQKYTSPVRIYKYPFELVMKAYERRFPICPQMPIVLDCSVIHDIETENGAKRETKRYCKLAVDAPYLFKKMIGIDVAFFFQTNFLDMRARTLNIEATNETFSSRVEIFEKCRYYVHPDNPNWTCFDQTATLDIKNFFGFEHSLEKWGMKQYTQTILKGKEIIEFFIEELKNEGITHVDKWVDPPGYVAPTETPAVEEKKENQEGSNNSASNNANSEEKSLSEFLDADYILKYLGQLSPLQESRLVQLRQKLEESEVKKYPDYPTLLRFLRARDFSIEKSYTMLVDSLKWREEHRVDHLLDEYRMPSVLTKHFPGGWHDFDKDGRPLYILRLGHMDVKGLLKSIGEDGLLKLTLHICEEGLKKMQEQTNREEKPIWSWCLLVDLEGLSMRHLWRPGVKALLRIIEVVEQNYPETMGRVLIVRAPRVFPILWTIVSAFIHENTRQKFLFFGGPDCLHIEDGLEHYMPVEKIPDFLGGPCTTLIHEGGLVPKSLYRNESMDEHDGSHHDHSGLYQTINLTAGQIFELMIKNNDPKSVITWDFDCTKADVLFTVYHTDKELPNDLGDSYSSIFDLSGFEEGVNYTKVEQTITCHPKESCQGSHEMMSHGTYILQWQLPPGSTTGAQLMYFYEILSSANYKGSMTSLQSAMSIASSQQSR
ncbi:protein real-time isoform X2 [Culicoides brevitarsis]|uniref:protein real-time isoform X2 n=1 Tax=Culicoides brevitarsis TaxID=469753 RepID=UPI00307C4324